MFWSSLSIPFYGGKNHNCMLWMMKLVLEVYWQFSFSAFVFKEQSPIWYLFVLQSPELWQGKNDNTTLTKLTWENKNEVLLYCFIRWMSFTQLQKWKSIWFIQEFSSVIPHFSGFDVGFRACYICLLSLSWMSVGIHSRLLPRLLSDFHCIATISACCIVTKRSWISAMRSASSFVQLIL